MGYCAWCNERVPFGGNKTAHNAVNLRDQAMKIARLMDAWSEAAANSDPPMEIPEETKEKIVYFVADGTAHAFAFHEYAHKRTVVSPDWAAAGWWARHAIELQAEILEGMKVEPVPEVTTTREGVVAVKCRACGERVRGAIAQESHRQMDAVLVRIATLAIGRAMADAADEHGLPREAMLRGPSIDSLLEAGQALAGSLHGAVHDPELGLDLVPPQEDIDEWLLAAAEMTRAASRTPPQMFAGRVSEMPRDWQRMVRDMV